MKRRIPLVAFLLLCCAVARAQAPDECTITGTIWLPGATGSIPNPNGKLTVREVRKSGELITLGSFSCKTDGANPCSPAVGQFSIKLRRSAFARIEAAIDGFRAPGGSTIQVPDATSALLSTIPIIPVPSFPAEVPVALPTQVKVKVANALVSSTIDTIDFLSGFTHTISPSGEINITAVAGGGGSVTVREVDGAPSIVITTLEFQQNSGFLVTDQTSGVARVDLQGVPYSKLSLSNSIVNADINGAAAIGWAKIDKSGSSLADLATRSAADLNAGILSDSRLSTNVTLLGNATTGAGSLVRQGSPTINTPTVTSPTFNLGGDAGGDIYYRSSGGALTRLGIGSNGQELRVSGGAPVWQDPGGGTAHTMLSATHTDTTAGTVARGDLIVGQGGTPTFQRLPLGGTNQALVSNGTDALWASLAKAHLPSAIAYEDEANAFAGVLTTAGRKLARTATAAASYTVVANDHIVAFTGTTQTATLPTAASAGAGTEYVFTDEALNASTNNKRIEVSGGGTIEGVTALVMDTNGSGVTVYSTGTTWKIRR